MLSKDHNFGQTQVVLMSPNNNLIRFASKLPENPPGRISDPVDSTSRFLISPVRSAIRFVLWCSSLSRTFCVQISLRNIVLCNQS
jgi:hypothetical protein